MIKNLNIIISLFLFVSLNNCKKNEIKKNTIVLEKQGSGISIQQCRNYTTKLYKNDSVIIGLTYNLSDDCKTIEDTVLDVYKNSKQENNQLIKRKILKENQNYLIGLNDLFHIKWNRKHTDTIYYNQDSIRIIKSNKIDYLGFNIIQGNLLCFYIDMGNCCDTGEIDMYKMNF